MPTRVKQAHDGAGDGIDACDARPLVLVAWQTGERPIACIVGATVFGGDDVIELVPDGNGPLRHTAVFADSGGPLANQLEDWIRHEITVVR